MIFSHSQNECRPIFNHLCIGLFSYEFYQKGVFYGRIELLNGTNVGRHLIVVGGQGDIFTLTQCA